MTDLNWNAPVTRAARTNLMIAIDQFNTNDRDPSYQEITRKLCNDIRQGKYDPGASNSDRLSKVLTEIVGLQLDIYSPKYEREDK